MLAMINMLYPNKMAWIYDLVPAYWLPVGFFEIQHCLCVITKVLFKTDKEIRRFGRKMRGFEDPLSLCELLESIVTPGQLTFDFMLSSESGDSIEKQIKVTHASLYANGLRRS